MIIYISLFCGIILGLLVVDYLIPLKSKQQEKITESNKLRRYRLIKDFRNVREGDHLIEKNGKYYHWRSQFGYVKEND